MAPCYRPVISYWAGEARGYDIRSNACKGVSAIIAVVWEQDTSGRLCVGTIAARSLVCNYDPPGNVVGYRLTERQMRATPSQSAVTSAASSASSSQLAGIQFRTVAATNPLRDDLANISDARCQSWSTDRAASRSSPASLPSRAL